MKATLWRLPLAMVAVLLPEPGAGASVTPVLKAVQMLKGMLQAGKEDQHQEQLQYAAFERFCIDVSADKNRTIKAADSKLELLRAEIQKHDTEVDRLGVEVQGHQAKATSLQNDTEAAAAVRAAERQDYQAMHQNYSESISALTDAIASLKKAATSKILGGAALVQRVLPSLSRLPAANTSAIFAFLERSADDPDLTFVSAPEATTYEFQSSDIVKMLEQLLDKFRDELRALESEEVTRRHAFSLLDQDFENAIKTEKAAAGSKSSSIAKHKQSAVELRAEAKDTSTIRTDEAAYLEDLQATCTTKEAQYQQRQQIRSEELATLEKAIVILTSDEVAGAAQQHLPSLIKLSSLRGAGSRSLAQLHSTRGDGPGSLLRAAEFLGAEAQRLNSRVLSVMATNARDDPFAKVKKLIEELITRLMTQATQEATHNGWCNTELATNLYTRKSKSQEVETLRAEIDDLGSSIAELHKDLATLSSEIAIIDKEVAKATAIRAEEQARNANTTADAQEGQAALQTAIQLLRDFYETAHANATSLAQSQGSTASRVAHKQGRGAQEPPPIFDDEMYAGQQVASGGIVAMLDVIHSDFVRLEQDTAMAEMSAAEAHRQFMEDSRVAKAQMESDVKHKTAERDSKELTLSDKQQSLSDAQRLLDSAYTEYDKLKPACINTGQTYEERVSLREAEIEALKKALEILSGEGVPVSSGMSR